LLVCDFVILLLILVMCFACVGYVICVIICTISMAESLNQSYIRLTAERLSHSLVAFADTVLQPRALREIYTSVDYDVVQINGCQVVNKLSNALGKLSFTFRTVLMPESDV